MHFDTTSFTQTLQKILGNHETPRDKIASG